jgi:hypothetical protein
MTELTAAQKAYVRKVLGDAVLFATHFLGAQLWEREAEILRSIQTYRRTAIKACHGAGKTYSLALAALWWLARYQQGIVFDHVADTPPSQNSVMGGDSSHCRGRKDSLSRVEDDRTQVSWRR